MAVLQTKKIHICALNKDRSQILEDLQRSGSVQIETDGDADAVFSRTDTAPEKNRLERQARNAQESLKALDTYAPEKKGMFAAFEGKKVLSAAEYREQEKAIEETMQTADRILALQKKISEERARAVRAENALESLIPWKSLDIPLDSKGTKNSAVFIGALPGQWTMDTLLSAIAAAQPELEAFDAEILGADQDQTCIFAVCAKQDGAALDDALRVNGFVRPSVQADMTPEQYSEKLQAEKADAEKAAEAAKEELISLSDCREQLRFAEDYFSMRAEKDRVLGELLQSEHVFFLNGYIPANRADSLTEKLTKKYTCEVETEDVPDDEEAPVLLKNNSFAAPTEGVVAAFGLPKKGEIDPTSIMAVFYYFFFGLMLSDAGYGLVMVLICIWAIKKFPNMDDGLKRMLRLFFYGGVSTVIWGVLFGGYFGDVLNIVSRTWFHHEIAIPALWFVPLNDPVKLLMFSFLFGIIHLFAGLGIKGYMLLRDKAYMDFLCSVVVWYALLIGLLLLLLPSEMFASMAGVTIVFPAWLNALAKWMSIISAIWIVVFSERGTKNLAVRIALGAYDLYGVSSWLSDVLSYSRLLALGLATGVIGTVINTMGSMVGDSIIGFIVFWIIFFVGHPLNVAINLLGAYVHTNRLQYVEFFGKFYEGGGKPFLPFSAEKNKYYRVIE